MIKVKESLAFLIYVDFFKLKCATKDKSQHSRAVVLSFLDDKNYLGIYQIYSFFYLFPEEYTSFFIF